MLLLCAYFNVFIMAKMIRHLSIIMLMLEYRGPWPEIVLRRIASRVYLS